MWSRLMGLPSDVRVLPQLVAEEPCRRPINTSFMSGSADVHVFFGNMRIPCCRTRSLQQVGVRTADWCGQPAFSGTECTLSMS